MTAIIAWIFIASCWGLIGNQYAHTHLETVWVCEGGQCAERQQRVQDH